MKKYNETLLIPRKKDTRNIIIIHLWKSIMNNIVCTFIRKILRKKKKNIKRCFNAIMRPKSQTLLNHYYLKK